jgi:peptidyl-prolyl cis-trans isomerase C
MASPVLPPGANASPVPAPAPPSPNKVLIQVGDQTITYAQFENIIDGLPEQYRAQARGPNRVQLANQLVRVLVLAQEAKKRKLDESPAFKTQLMFQQSNVLASMAFEQLTKEAGPKDADLKAYYDEHKSDYEQVKARHILIRMKGSPVPVKPGQKELTDEEALAKAQELRKKIQGGEDFAAVARAESDDTMSGQNGGEVGPFHKGQMVPSFEQAAFAMKPGELSEPVKSQFGYHVIQLESKETGSFEAARNDVAAKLKAQSGQNAQKAVEELQKNAKVLLDPDFFAAPAAAPAPSPPTPAPAK